MTRRANRKKRFTVLYIVEHPNQEGDTCIDWTSQYCWTNGWNCLWRGHSVYRNRPLIPPTHGPRTEGRKAMKAVGQAQPGPNADNAPARGRLRADACRRTDLGTAGALV